MYPSIFGAAEMRSRGAKRADRPRTFAGDDTAEDCRVRLCWDGEGADSDPGIQPVPTLET